MDIGNSFYQKQYYEEAENIYSSLIKVFFFILEWHAKLLNIFKYC